MAAPPAGPPGAPPHPPTAGHAVTAAHPAPAMPPPPPLAGETSAAAGAGRGKAGRRKSGAPTTAGGQKNARRASGAARSARQLSSENSSGSPGSGSPPPDEQQYSAYLTSAGGRPGFGRVHRSLPAVTAETWPAVLAALAASRQPGWPSDLAALLNRLPACCFYKAAPHVLLFAPAGGDGQLRFVSVYCHHGMHEGVPDGNMSKGPSGNYTRHRNCTPDKCAWDRRPNDPQLLRVGPPARTRTKNPARARDRRARRRDDDDSDYDGRDGAPLLDVYAARTGSSSFPSPTSPASPAGYHASGELGASPHLFSTYPAAAPSSPPSAGYGHFSYQPNAPYAAAAPYPPAHATYPPASPAYAPPLSPRSATSPRPPQPDPLPLSSSSLLFLLNFDSRVSEPLCRPLPAQDTSFVHQAPDYLAVLLVEPLGDAGCRLTLAAQRTHPSPLDAAVAAKAAILLDPALPCLAGGWGTDPAPCLPLHMPVPREPGQHAAVVVDLGVALWRARGVLAAFAAKVVPPPAAAGWGWDEATPSDGGSGRESGSGWSGGSTAGNGGGSGASGSSGGTVRWEGGGGWREGGMQDGEWSGSEEEDGEEEYDEEDYGSEEDVLEVELRGEESGDETGYESLDEEWADPADALAEPVDVHPAETFESAAALPPFEGLPPLDGLAEPLPPPQAKPSSNSLWGAALASALASAGGFLSRASDRLSGTGTPLPDPKPELESGIANLTLGGPSYVPPMRASNAIFPVVPDPDSPSYAGPGERVEELWGERRCHGLFGWRRSDGTEVLTFSRPVKTAELVVWQDGDKAIFGINSGARIEGIFGSSVRVWSYVGAGNNVRYCVRATLK